MITLTVTDRARAAMTAGLAALAAEKLAGHDRAHQLRAYSDALEVAHVPAYEDVPPPERLHCRQAGCYCTHTSPCQAGWLDIEPSHQNGHTYQRVVPCPQCRPDAYARYVVRIETTSTVRN